MSSGTRRNALVVEFIGASGVGKSTLVPAVANQLSERGFRVLNAEDVILANYGLSFMRWRKLRSVLVHLLSLKPFACYVVTKAGFRLSRLALRLIARDSGGIRIGASLVRNFIKRIGFHFLLDKVRATVPDCDVILCDEGIVHAAHNLFVHAGSQPKTDEIVQFANMVPKPDFLIWVTAPTAHCVDVLLARGHSRVDSTTSSVQAFIERAHATFQVLASLQGIKEALHRVENVPGDHEPPATDMGRAVNSVVEFLQPRLWAVRSKLSVIPWPDSSQLATIVSHE